MVCSDTLFRFQRGDHICVFYRDETTLLETLIPYLAEGLRRGEKCFCVQSPEVLPRLRSGMRWAGLDAESESARGALECHSVDEIYGGGEFSSAAMMALLEDSIATAVKQGFSGFRSAGELGWAAGNPQLCNQIVEYEGMVDATFPSRPAIGLCQYSVQQFPAPLLERILRSHRMALAQTMSGGSESHLTIRNGEYFVEIVADRNDPKSRFYFVVQQEGRRDVLAWGAEPTFEAACQRAESEISAVVRRAQNSASIQRKAI